MHQSQTTHVHHRDLFATFFKIGLFTFGGGYAMIPLIEREIIDHWHWIEEKDLLDLMAISQSLPGAFAINISTFIGLRLKGRKGAIVSTLGCALPSFMIILVIATGLARFQDNVLIQRFFLGVRAAVTAQILIAAIKMGRKIILDPMTASIAATAFLLVMVIGLHPIVTVLGGAGVGMLLYWFFPSYSHAILEPKAKGKAGGES